MVGGDDGGDDGVLCVGLGQAQADMMFMYWINKILSPSDHFLDIQNIIPPNEQLLKGRRLLIYPLSSITQECIHGSIQTNQHSLKYLIII